MISWKSKTIGYISRINTVCEPNTHDHAHPYFIKWKHSHTDCAFKMKLFNQNIIERYQKSYQETYGVFVDEEQVIADLQSCTTLFFALLKPIESE